MDKNLRFWANLYPFCHISAGVADLAGLFDKYIGEYTL